MLMAESCLERAGNLVISGHCLLVVSAWASVLGNTKVLEAQLTVYSTTPGQDNPRLDNSLRELLVLQRRRFHVAMHSA